MSGVWLHIVGMGEAGLDSLMPATRAVVEAAEVIVASDRLHDRTPGLTGERLRWPSPFDALISTIKAQEGRRVVVLATGDPLWFSVGARIGRGIDPAQICYHPQLSAFQLSAARLGWSLADTELLTAHGRPPEQILPFVGPGARLLLLTKDRTTPKAVAAMLCARGYGGSRMTVLAHLGGDAEARFDGLAQDWSAEVPDFHTLAIDCVAGPEAQVLSRVAGLADDLFVHDGKMTKREVRAVTLARLMPRRGGMLWDIGSGAGSVGIEWMRAARDARAIGIEPLADRRDMAARNALALGVPRLQLVAGRAPEALVDLPRPDAVFIGGGLSEAAARASLAALAPHGWLVANAVTLESEALLLSLHARLGGDLTRIRVERVRPVGPYHGWQPFMPVTQWAIQAR
ncbi:precorrin-6y C5,15-methyltransferase (decarboxylating) subunit CbiE [Pseudoruegeria sp. SK021]|uniref:precorrin-6y C5,15-methyltransferase (decarboxylating) subunit CbiE n=1 Tax=Pseudoruegeria sp. SK021 TaxID=1933035 RepID=UPI000A25AF6F|nr:precorrin-6y C5,15-methyltransferase (decarboxylating) subunit CbiE [Pseudoruegeria sp. SK021]OSP55744.1 cobalamin biosynthesis bifunctional protein CbiET [Pseudoruegeria sp. SK021]